MSGVDIAGLVEELRSLADCDARSGEPLGRCMRRAADVIERGHEHTEYIEAQWLAKDAALKSATRQRDEALTALKASEEREAALLAALRPFALAARDCDVEDDIRIGVVKPDQDIWESPVAMSITFAHVANALQLRENCKAPLADATNNPPSDPGTEQREVGR